MKDLLLLTKPMDFSAIAVTASSVQEFPLDNFIQRGEIVLSTAIGHETQPDFFPRMIRDIHAAGAAAIAFSFKDPSFRLPAGAVEVANSLSLPVFQMPWEYRFSDFQASLIHAISRKERSFFEKIQSTLFNYFFDFRPLDYAVRYLSKTFRCPVEVAELSGKTAAAAGFFSSREGRAELSPSLQMDIRIGSAIFGTLRFYPGADRTPPAGTEILERCVAYPLSLWFYRKTVEDITTARLKNDFVWNLARNNFDSEEEMLRQSAYLHFQLNRPYLCIAMHFSFQDGKTPSSRDSHRGSRYASGMEQVFLTEAKHLEQNTMIGSLGTEFVIYFEASGADAMQAVSTYLDTVENALGMEFPAAVCYWGISGGGPEPAAQDFAQLYKNASAALRYCINSQEKSRRFTYQKTQKMQMISLLSESPGIRRNVRELLGRLLQESAGTRTDLLNTLSVYIRSNYNASQAARELQINRQSMLYRLEKIEALTGMSLSCHDDLFVLETLLYVYYTG